MKKTLLVMLGFAFAAEHSFAEETTIIDTIQEYQQADELDTYSFNNLHVKAKMIFSNPNKVLDPKVVLKVDKQTIIEGGGIIAKDDVRIKLISGFKPEIKDPSLVPSNLIVVGKNKLPFDDIESLQAKLGCQAQYSKDKGAVAFLSSKAEFAGFDFLLGTEIFGETELKFMIDAANVGICEFNVNKKETQESYAKLAQAQAEYKASEAAYIAKSQEQNASLNVEQDLVYICAQRLKLSTLRTGNPALIVFTSNPIDFDKAGYTFFENGKKISTMLPSEADRILDTYRKSAETYLQKTCIERGYPVPTYNTKIQVEKIDPIFACVDYMIDSNCYMNGDIYTPLASDIVAAAFKVKQTTHHSQETTSYAAAGSGGAAS